MCGIAYISKLTPNNVDGFLLLCYEMQDRGSDSFGFTDGDVVWKWDKAFTEVWRPVKDILSTLSTEGKSILAHTRAASVGEVNIENSHPFRMVDPTDEHRCVIGVHNGGIGNYNELNSTYNRDFKVDSQHIFQHLAESKEMEDLRGYGTVVWYERIKRGEKVSLFEYFVVFNNGSISVAQYEEVGEKIIILASTEGPITKVCSVMGVDPTFYNISGEKRYEIQGGDVYIDGEMKFGGTGVVYSGGRRWNPQYGSESLASGYVNSGSYVIKGDRFNREVCLLCALKVDSPNVVCMACIKVAIDELPLKKYNDTL